MLNGHSRIKKTRVCDCVTINYRDANVYKCIHSQSHLLPIRFATCKL